MSQFFLSHRYCPEMISLIKRNSCGKALDIARMARDMLGGKLLLELILNHHLVSGKQDIPTRKTVKPVTSGHAVFSGSEVN